MKTQNPFSKAAPGSRLPLVALLLVQVVVGYEWLNSAFTKIVRGGFATGLGDQLSKNADGAPGFYQAVLNGIVIPNSAIFGYLVEVGELVVGATLVATAAVLIVRGSKLNAASLRTVTALVAMVAFGGAFMNLNFSLFGGDQPVWSLGPDAFSEGVTIDNLLMLVQLTMAGTSAALFYSLREAREVRHISRIERRALVTRRAA